MFSLQTKGPEIHFLLIIYERANFEGKFSDSMQCYGGGVGGSFYLIYFMAL